MNKSPCNWLKNAETDRLTCTICLTSMDAGTTPVCPVAPVLDAEVSGAPLTAPEALAAVPTETAAPQPASPIQHENVVRFSDRKPVFTPEAQDMAPDKELIEGLEKLLDDVKSGRVIKFAYAAVHARDSEGFYGTTTGFYVNGPPAPFGMLVATVGQLNHNIHVAWRES